MGYEIRIKDATYVRTVRLLGGIPKLGLMLAVAIVFLFLTLDTGSSTASR